MHSFLLRAALVSSVVVAAAACSSAEDPSTDGTEEDLKSADATITFAADGFVKGPTKLVEGQMLTVKYVLGRTAPCNGRPNKVGIADGAGHVTEFVFDTESQFCATCFDAAHIIVPSGPQISIWAETQDWDSPNPATCFDANNGKNFAFAVKTNPKPTPTITFAPDGGVRKDGELVPGKKAQIRYSTKRTGCRVKPNMSVDGAPGVTPFDDGPAGAPPVQVATGHGDADIFEVFNFTVPNGKELAFWFETDPTGASEPAPRCSSRWDSNDGHNFLFSVR